MSSHRKEAKPKVFLKEFCRDVIAVARNRDGSLVQVAKDFGVLTMCLLRWSIIAVVEDEVRSGITIAETAEISEIKKWERLLEQEVEILRRATAYLSHHVLPK